MILQNYSAKVRISNISILSSLNTFGVYVLSQKHILGDTEICIAHMTVGSNIYVLIF